MTLTLNISVALLIALGLSIGLYLVGGSHEARAAQALATAEAALGTVRDPGAQQSGYAEATAWETTLGPLFRVLASRTDPTHRSLVRSTALRVTLAQRLIPSGILALVVGLLAGLLRRDRARELVLYSSVTYSYIGKFLALSAIAYGVFVAISPFAPPLWSIYPAVGVSALGVAMHIGNLPPRL